MKLSTIFIIAFFALSTVMTSLGIVSELRSKKRFSDLTGGVRVKMNTSAMSIIFSLMSLVWILNGTIRAADSFSSGDTQEGIVGLLLALGWAEMMVMSLIMFRKGVYAYVTPDRVITSGGRGYNPDTCWYRLNENSLEIIDRKSSAPLKFTVTEDRELLESILSGSYTLYAGQ